MNQIPQQFEVSEKMPWTENNKPKKGEGPG